MNYGKGKIVFMGSNFQFSNDWGRMLDDERLGLNIIKELAKNQ